jgi:hypothetical protein
MTIQQFLDGNTFDARQVAIIAAAYEQILQRLDIQPGSQPEREERVSRMIIAIANRRLSDENSLVREALTELV